MPYTRLRYHIVFATKNRARWIWPHVEEFLYPVLVRQIERAGGHTIRLGGVQDHVHTICALKPKISVSDFVERIKSESSQAVRGKFENLWGFHWQDGYGAFSLNPLDMDRVIEYVENQKEHHRRGTLWKPYEELTALEAHDASPVDEAPEPPDRTRIISRTLRRRHKLHPAWGAACFSPGMSGCPAKKLRDSADEVVDALRLL